MPTTSSPTLSSISTLPGDLDCNPPVYGVIEKAVNGTMGDALLAAVQSAIVRLVKLGVGSTNSPSLHCTADHVQLIQPGIDINAANTQDICATPRQVHKQWLQRFPRFHTDEGYELFETVLDLTEEIEGHIPSQHPRFWADFDNLETVLARYARCVPPAGNDTTTEREGAGVEAGTAAIADLSDSIVIDATRAFEVSQDGPLEDQFSSTPPIEGLLEGLSTIPKLTDDGMADERGPTNLMLAQETEAPQIVASAVECSSASSTEGPLGEVSADPMEGLDQHGQDILNQLMESFDLDSVSGDEDMDDEATSNEVTMGDESTSDDDIMDESEDIVTSQPPQQAIPLRIEPAAPVFGISESQDQTSASRPQPVVHTMNMVQPQQQGFLDSRPDSIAPNVDMEDAPQLACNTTGEDRITSTSANLGKMQAPVALFGQTQQVTEPPAFAFANFVPLGKDAPVSERREQHHEPAERTKSVSEAVQLVFASPAQPAQTFSIPQRQEQNRNTAQVLKSDPSSPFNLSHLAQTSSVPRGLEQSSELLKQKRPSARAAASTNRQIDMQEVDSPAPSTTPTENTLDPTISSTEEDFMIPDTAFFEAQKEPKPNQDRRDEVKSQSTMHQHTTHQQTRHQFAKHARALLTDIIAEYRKRHPINYSNIPDSQIEPIFHIMLELERKKQKPPGWLGSLLKKYLCDVKTGASFDWQAWVAECMLTFHIRDLKPDWSDHNYVPTSDRLDALRKLYEAMDYANFMLSHKEGRFITYEDLKAAARQQELRVHDMNAFNGSRSLETWRSKAHKPAARWRADPKKEVFKLYDEKYGQAPPSTLQPSFVATKRAAPSTAVQKQDEDEDEVEVKDREVDTLKGLVDTKRVKLDGSAAPAPQAPQTTKRKRDECGEGNSPGGEADRQVTYAGSIAKPQSCSSERSTSSNSTMSGSHVGIPAKLGTSTDTNIGSLENATIQAAANPTPCKKRVHEDDELGMRVIKRKIETVVVDVGAQQIQAASE